MTAVLPRTTAIASTDARTANRGILTHLDALFSLKGGRLRHDVSAGTALELRGPFRRGSEPPRFFLRNVTTGIFGGDDYRVHVAAGNEATVWVSASSATKVHSMPGMSAVLSTELEVLPGATLLWGQHPTILQAESNLSMHSRWTVHEGGLLLAAEVLSFGREASGEGMSFTRYGASQLIEDGGARPLVEERYELRPGDSLRQSLEGRNCLVSVYAVGRVAGLLDALAPVVEGWAGYAGIGALPNDAGLVVRALASSLHEGTVFAESLLQTSVSTAWS